MVSCKAIIANLSSYLDGDATPEMGEKIEKHLRRCHRCTAVYDSTRKMLVITGTRGYSRFRPDSAIVCTPFWIK